VNLQSFSREISLSYLVSNRSKQKNSRWEDREFELESNRNKNEKQLKTFKNTELRRAISD
jgi:hypothetical protein